jgi:rRNA processing protein Krr1/Pno1
MRKIERGFEELQEAMKVIDDESMGALNELRDVKQRQKDIEGLLERAVGKL